MKKSMIALGAVALCGSVLADVSSSNVVGYSNVSKTDAKYESFGCPFVSVGAAGDTFKLYDLQITGSMNAMSMKNNYIQMMDPATLILDPAMAFYWNPTQKYWCYKYSVAGGQTKDTKVPEDTTFTTGYGFLCTFANTVGIQFAGQVLKPTVDADGYYTIGKPTASAKYFFVNNPFPTEISLADIYIGGSMNAMSMKNNYIQYMQKNTLMLDAAKAYYWNPTKKCWCYKYSEGGQTKDTTVTDAATIKIRPGEGFLMTAPNAVTLQIKAPAALLSL